MTRNSTLVIIGRVIQKFNPRLYNWIERIFFPFFKENSSPQIFIISKPRSGSTLTYQVLTNGINSIYLTNFTNLLVGLPFLTLLFSKLIGVKRIFKSNYGFVPGINGHAEGLAFWKYWIDQDLSENNNHELNFKKSKYLLKSIQKAQGESVFISAYLSHIFCLNKLRDIFPNPIFIFLKRDELSNIYSLYKGHKKYNSWMSLKPKNINESNDHFENAVNQYFRLEKVMSEHFDHNDSFCLNYEDICKNPHKSLELISKELNKRGYQIELNPIKFPDFKAKIYDEKENTELEKLNDLRKKYKCQQ